MEETLNQNPVESTPTPAPTVTQPVASERPEGQDNFRGPRRGRGGMGGRGGMRRSRGGERPKSEFDQKVLEIARVSRVTKGGKRFSFRATVVIGDGKLIFGNEGVKR